MRLIVRPDAEADIAAAYDWYEEQREGLGREFLEEISVTIEAASGNNLDTHVTDGETESMQAALLAAWTYRSQ